MSEDVRAASPPDAESLLQGWLIAPQRRHLCVVGHDYPTNYGISIENHGRSALKVDLRPVRTAGQFNRLLARKPSRHDEILMLCCVRDLLEIDIAELYDCLQLLTHAAHCRSMLIFGRDEEFDRLLRHPRLGARLLFGKA